MKILAISDTHGFEDEVKIPDVDMIVCGGDATNYKDYLRNQLEFDKFYNWWSNLNIKHKVLIAGNHDRSLLKNYNKDKVKECSIYLEHEYTEVEGLKIFGSPYTLTFGDWFFMMNHNKLNLAWEVLEKDIDILITHGPPKGILDLAERKYSSYEYCGDSNLLRKIRQVNPKHHIFGHIHDGYRINNFGTRTVADLDTTFYNVSSVRDGDFDKGLIHNGIIIEI